MAAVVDGVGHGKEAARAARKAIATLDLSVGKSPVALFQRCHEQLRSTRGVVMSLASFNANDNTLAWLGVGNVEGVLFHRQNHILPGEPPTRSSGRGLGLLGIREKLQPFGGVLKIESAPGRGTKVLITVPRRG